MFRKFVPKNLVPPTLRDVKQNVCPLKAYNRFLVKNKAKDLQLPVSTIDICLLFICNPNPEKKDENRNPLNWKPACTKGKCPECLGQKWIDDQVKNLKSRKITGNVTYPLWVSEREGKKTTQTLKKMNLGVSYFTSTI